MELFQKELVLTWDKVWKDTITIASAIDRMNHDIDIVVGIERGGLIPAAMIARYLGLCMFSILPQDDYTLRQFKGNKILIVDDIFDTGRTINEIEYNAADINKIYVTIYNKYKDIDSSYPIQEPILSIPIEDSWIVFPWENKE